MTIKHTVVLDHYGDYVGLEGRRLMIKSKDEVKYVPIDEIESLLFTNMQSSISLKALSALLEAGAGLSILNRGQSDICSVSPKPAHALQMNAIQHRWRENGIGTRLAKKVIVDKGWHQKRLVYEMMRRAQFKKLTTRQQQHIEKSYQQLDHTLSSIKHAHLPDFEYEQFLFTHEAQMAKAYWKAIAAWLPQELNFRGRRLQGDTPDPFNAALNYGYAILATRITHQLSGLGFDPHLGFLHADQPPRMSMTYDVIERYRQRFVDVPLLKYCFSHPCWELNDQDRLPKSVKQEISECILQALDPRSPQGMALIIEDCQKLRQALLQQKTWQTTALSRKGLAPL